MNTLQGPHASSAFPRPGGATARLPQLCAPGDPVDASACVEPRTGVALAISGVLALLGCLLLVLSVYGALIALALTAVEYFAIRRARTILRGSALRVGPSQFPELHTCVESHAQRLSLDELPEVFVIDAAEVNGFALRLGRRNGIFLTDEAVAGCLEGRSPGALSFVVAHELAHLALGHQRWWRRHLARFRWLSRLDECTADNVACELVGSSDSAQDGILLLVAGPRLLAYVDREAARSQAAEVAGEPASRRAERSLTHPLVLRRLDRVARRFPERPLARAA
jgi:Zn-dependent protease with chaperone function